MKILKVPFEVAEDRGVTIDLKVPDTCKLIEYRRPEPKMLDNVEEALINAIENPINSKKFSELISGGKKVLFMIENQFRQAQVNLLLPTLVKMVEEAGGTARIICASGKVGALNDEEIKEKIGEELYNTGIEVTSNDPMNPEAYTFMGVTSRGIPIWVHKWVAEADVKVTIGTTQATLWGYGGSGMVIPGTVSNETIEMNHVMSLSPTSKPGNNETDIQLDKYEALKICNIDMGINVITSNLFEIVYINAGDPVDSHKESIKAYDEIYRFDYEEKADIVICGSTAPTDHLFFHTSWAIVNADPITKDDGTIIFTTPCPGYGAWNGFALMDVLKPYMPATPENHEKVLRDFYSHKNELWAGCIWYKIYEVMVRKNTEIITLKENIEFARNVG